MAADRTAEVLDATYTCLSRYGVRRTTVDDIAREMGASRSAVYRYVRGKDDAVRRLTRRLHDRAVERAEAAAASDAPPAERVHGILAAKLDLVLDLAGRSPHAVELLDPGARLCGDICDAFTARLRTLLTEQFQRARAAGRCQRAEEAGAPHGARRPAAGATPGQAADICLALVAGLQTAPDAARLLRPATDALLPGLLPAPAPLPHHR
ncbi:helix-turn-helix domain-containing protein [Streptomyces sp. PmtG]